MSFPKLMIRDDGEVVRFTAPGKGVIVVSGSSISRVGLIYDWDNPECIEELMSEFVDYWKGME